MTTKTTEKLALLQKEFSACSEKFKQMQTLLTEAIALEVAEDKPPVVVVEPPRVNPTDANQKLLWHPMADTSIKMKTRGKYPNNYPMGVVVHYTAGHSLRGIKDAYGTANYGLTQGHAYHLISREGILVATHPLDEYGWHAGDSSWPSLGTGLSSKLLGIEINCAGNNLIKNADGSYRTDFGETHSAENVRVFKEDKDNIEKGIYLKYTQDQETTLTHYILWLKRNNPSVFDLDYVLGHDEVATPKGRKVDPGGSLSMTMLEYREFLKKEYAKGV